MNCLLSSRFNQSAQNVYCAFEDLSLTRQLASRYNVFRVPEVILVNNKGEILARHTCDMNDRESVRPVARLAVKT